MNGEMIAGLVRHILTFGGGIVVSKGYIDNDTMMQLVAGIASLIGLGWSAWAKWGGGAPSLKSIALPLLLVGGTGLGGCALLGIDPEDSASAREEASRIVKVLRTVDGVVGIAVTEADIFCADTANAEKWPCTTDYPAAAKIVSVLIGEHLARLDTALSDTTTDDVLFATLVAQGWDVWGDALDVVNHLRGISPTAKRVVAG